MTATECKQANMAAPKAIVVDRFWQFGIARKWRRALFVSTLVVATVVGSSISCHVQASGAFRVDPRQFSVQVDVDTDYGNDAVVPRNGHAICRIYRTDNLSGNIQVTIADVDAEGRLSPSTTTFTVPPANGTYQQFTIAGMQKSLNVGDALLQVRLNGKKLGRNVPVTVYWLNHTSMNLASLQDYQMQYFPSDPNTNKTSVVYWVPNAGFGVGMIAKATLNPLAVGGVRINAQRLAVMQNILGGHTACVYRTVSFVGWGPGVDRGYALSVPAEYQRVTDFPWCVDSLTHNYPQTVWGATVMAAGQNLKAVQDAPTQGSEWLWHQRSFYGGHPSRWIATIEYSNPGFEYNVDFRDWAVVYDDNDLATAYATMSKWAEADWHLHITSAKDSQRITSAENDQVYPSKLPRDTIKFGGRLGNDYNQVQDWKIYGAATVTFRN